MKPKPKIFHHMVNFAVAAVGLAWWVRIASRWYCLPPTRTHSSSNSLSRISALGLLVRPVASRVISHMLRSSLPVKRVRRISLDAGRWRLKPSPRLLTMLSEDKHIWHLSLPLLHLICLWLLTFPFLYYHDLQRTSLMGFGFTICLTIRFQLHPKPLRLKL